MSLLTIGEIDARLMHLEEWQHVDGTLVRQYEMKNFDAALVFVNKVGEAANKADHHPDIKIFGWNKVEIVLTTHSKGGITEKDFELAVKIEKLAQ